MSIQFGTEGWRAIMGEEFTADNVRAVAQAMAEHLKTQKLSSSKEKRVVIGYDTRFMSDYYAKVAAEVFAGNGFRVVLTTGHVPTCSITRYVYDHQLPMGVMVTASHNPAVYNGLKVKEPFGGSGSRETVASIEDRIGKGMIKRQCFEDAQAEGKIAQEDIVPAYLKGIRQFVDLKAVKAIPFRLVVDSMHGVGGRYFEQLLKGGEVQVQTIRAERDPFFGGNPPEPIAEYLKPLSQAVRSEKADLGLANDGDADRVGIVGPDGQWLNPGQLLCVLLDHLVHVRRQTGSVVKTVSNTMMINRLTDQLGLPLDEVPVGFRFVAERMRAGDVLIGGEESGGIGLNGYLPERDGIMIGLLTLEAIAMSGKRLPQLIRALERDCGKWYYARRDLMLKPIQVERLFKRLQKDPPSTMAGISVKSVNYLDGVKLVGRDDSWLLFRRSGTEPIARVYAETSDQNNLEKLLDVGVGLTR